MEGNITTEQIYKAIAVELMEEMARGKDIKTIYSREKILEILNKIKEKGYYMVHQDLNNANEEAMNNFNQNKDMIFKTLVKKIEKEIGFPIELYKYGKTFNGLKKRWALINDDGLFSLTDKSKKVTSKNKTQCLQNSKINWEKKVNQTQPEWAEPKKEHRIIIEFENEKKKNRKDHIHLYFENEKQLNECKDKLFSIKSKKNEAAIINNLKGMQKMIEGSYLFYGVFKLLEAKRRVKNRKVLLNSMKNNISQSIEPLNKFIRYSFSTWANKYKNSKSIYLQNKKSTTFPKWKVLYTNFPPKSGELVNKQFLSMNTLKNKVNFIVKNFPEFFGGLKKNDSLLRKTSSNMSKIQLLGNLKKFIGFKLQNTDFQQLSNERNSLSQSKLSNFDLEKFKRIYCFTLNKKKMEINFSENCSLTRADILDISNLFVNLDMKNQNNENYLIINGPKIDTTKYLKYNYKKSFLPELAKEKFVEPELHALSMNQANGKNYKALCLQIFHAIFKFGMNVTEYFEVENRDNKSADFKFDNPLNDFLFFISITVNKNYKLRTKLVKAKKYENNNFIIEFNLQHLLNFDSLNVFNPFELKVSLNLIPAKSFLTTQSDEEKNYFVEYLKPFEMGFCIVNEEKINNRQFEFSLVKEGVNLPEENKILMNMFVADNSRIEQTKFYGKEFNVGNEIYALEELDQEFFKSRMADSRIDSETKNKIYNVKISNDGSILLRPPLNDSEFSSLKTASEEEFLEKLTKESKINAKELNGVVNNKNYNFIPYCEKYFDKKTLENSKNLSLNTNQIVDYFPQVGEWIYKLPSIKKYFLGNFKGITENRNFVYHNYFTNEVKVNKINNPLYDVNRKYRPAQENLFGIYDFNEIDESSLENGLNYHWRLGFKFMDKNEMNAFIFFLKDLRRRANLAEKKEKMIISNPINTNILSEMTKNVKSTLRCLKVMPVQIEFRQNYTLNEDKQILVKLSKANISDRSVQQGRYMLEALDESESLGFKNSLTENENIRNDIKLLKNMKNDSKTLPKGYDVSAQKFNESSKIVKFGDKVEWGGKLLEIESKPGVDKVFTMEIKLKGTKSDQTLYSNLNFDNIINFRPQAEVMYAPLTLEETNNICGIIYLQAWAVNPGNYQNFEDIFNKDMEASENKLTDEYGNYVTLGRYDPNVYRRGVLRIIHSHLKSDINTLISKLDDNKVRQELYKILSKKCIKYCDDLLLENYKSTDSHRWKDLIPDFKIRHAKILKKFYMNKKRNDFYHIFAKCEWELFFKSYLSQVKGQTVVDPNNVFSLFPERSEIIYWKNYRNDFYYQLRYLFYIGLPVESRQTVWEGILNIKELVVLTKKKLTNLKFEDVNDNKKYIYNYYEELAKNPATYNNNFSLIDNDMNYIVPISENRNLNTIREIAKAFFLWSELNIATDKYVIGSSSANRKFVYFFGLLKIIQRIYSVLKDASNTFWIIIGLSQILDIFYQSNPLFNTELSYTKIYVLITKLIMETHLKSLYNKFLELGFPLEYFFSKLIPSLYCDLFQTELFLRLLDVIIFEAALKTNDYDKIDYLRVICTIPLTLLKLNEKKVLECKTVKEMERVFDDFVRKSFNNQKFVETVRENIEKFYEMKNFFERFLELNQDTSWDLRRARIENKLGDVFSKTHKENSNYLKKLKDAKFSLGNKFINNYQDIINERFISIRQAYSMGTPDNNISNIFSNDAKHGIAFSITNFYSFDDNFNINLNKPTQFYTFYEFVNQKINFRDFNFRIKSPSSSINVNLSDIDTGFNVVSTNITKQSFYNNMPKYLNIYLTDTAKNNIIGQYVLDIKKLDLMRPYKIRLESVSEDIYKTEIEICAFKYCLESIKDQESDLFNFLFAQPAYIYDTKLETELHGYQMLNINQILIVNKILNIYRTSLKKLNEHGHSKFVVEEFKKNCLGSDTRTKLGTSADNTPSSNMIEEVVKSLFEKEEDRTDPKSVIIDWIKNSDSSFEEILYAIILADSSSVTIHEKLKLIFDVASMKNYMIHNSDFLTIDKLKEMVYCLYKRFTVYFTRSDVDRLVDYLLKKEALTNYKWALLYDKKDSHKIEELAFDNDHASKSIASFMLNERFFIDIKKNFIILINILKNQFNLNSIPVEILTSLTDYFTSSNEIKINVDKLRIDIDNDNIKKVKILNVIKNNNKSISIDDNKYNIKNRFNSEDSLWEKIIIDLIDTIDESNTYVNNNFEISYDKFKDVFFNLPYISDLFRASCCFNSIDNSENSVIKTLQNVKVEVSYSDRERHHIRNFIFTENFDPNSYRGSSRLTNFNMNKALLSSMNIQDIVFFIIKILEDRQEIYDELKLFLENPNLISFYVINRESKLEEKLKYFDPLFSNSYVRNIDPYSQIDIVFKLEASDDMTRIDQNLVLAQNGFAKFKNVNIPSYHEWRECKIKENKVKFKCFDYQYYFKTNSNEIIPEDLI